MFIYLDMVESMASKKSGQKIQMDVMFVQQAGIVFFFLSVGVWLFLVGGGRSLFPQLFSLSFTGVVHFYHRIHSINYLENNKH
jgi:hypothetical protein